MPSRDTSFGQQGGEALLEPLACRLAECWGEFEIMVGADGVNVTKKSSQMRQLSLHVLPMGVPPFEHQNGGTVTKIMDAWRMPLRIEYQGTDAQPMPQTTQG